MSVLVTIAMAVRNGASTIRQAICSVRDQTYSNWELIVIDDSSTDDSMAIVNALNDPRIRILKNRRVIGLAASLNRAIDAANGQLFARLDVDDVAYPDRLERQVAFLENRPDIDLLGSRMMVFCDDGEPLGSPKSFYSHDALCMAPWKGFYLPHPTWIGRVEWFRRYHYDPRYIKAQDQELLLRAFRDSRYACLNEILVGYRQHSIELKKVWKGRYYLSRAFLARGQREQLYVRAILAVCIQTIKAVADTVAISSGLERRLLRHRALPAQDAEVKRWRDVWNDIIRETH